MRHALVTLGLVTSLAGAARAQVLGIPVVNNGAPTGITLGADVGFANEGYGKGTAVSGRAAIGLGFVGVGAAISHFSPSGGGDAVWSPGANATLRLLGGPLVPLRVTMQAGVGHWTVGGAHFTHVPVSLGISMTIPNPAFAIKPWIAPRLDVQHSSATSIEGDDVSSTKGHFAISGGVDVALLNGIAIRGAVDRMSVNGSTASLYSLGLGFAP